MLNLILVESGLERVPPNLWSHPDFRKYIQKFGRSKKFVILDINFHYNLLKKLDNWEKRGRPDIAHFCTLIALDSILYKKGYLNYWIHTYDDKIIYFKRDVRIPRHVERFKFLMGQVFHHGYVPPGSKEWLIKYEEKKLNEFVNERNFDKVILLDEKGKNMNPFKLGKYLMEFENPLVMIGGFQRGDFKEETRNIADEIISISEFPLMAWTVMYEVISSYELLAMKWSTE